MISPELSSLRNFLTEYRDHSLQTVKEINRWLEGLELIINKQDEIEDLKSDVQVLASSAYQHLVRSAEKPLDAAQLLKDLGERKIKIDLLPTNKLSIQLPRNLASPGLVAFLSDHEESIRFELGKQNATTPGD